jgi:hypothetical protein
LERLRRSPWLIKSCCGGCLFNGLWALEETASRRKSPLRRRRGSTNYPWFVLLVYWLCITWHPCCKITCYWCCFFPPQCALLLFWNCSGWQDFYICMKILVPWAATNANACIQTMESTSVAKNTMSFFWPVGQFTVWNAVSLQHESYYKHIVETLEGRVKRGHLTEDRI